MVKRRISTEDSVLLMSPQVIYGRPGPRLERIHRGEVQGTLTEYSSSAWQIGDVVGYAPMEKPPETLDMKSLFTDWSGFTWYVLGPLLRMVFWSSFFIVLMSPILFSLGFRGVGEEMAMILVIFFDSALLFPSTDFDCGLCRPRRRNLVAAPLRRKVSECCWGCRRIDAPAR